MICPSMQVLEIVAKYPETEPVLRSYDSITHCCVLCEHLFDTLEDLAQLCSVNVEDIVTHLNSIIDKPKLKNMERMAEL